MNLIDRFKALPIVTKRTLGIGTIIAMFIALPLFVWAIVTQRFDTNKQAASGEPVPQPTSSIALETAYAQFIASDFYIQINGQKFVGSPMVIIHSDAGSPNYTTLESTWFENGVQMRMYLYFGADSQNWWLKEARIYNGQANGNWTYLLQNAQAYKTPLGQKYSQNIPGGWLLAHSGSSDLADGVHFGHLDLQAFVNRGPNGSMQACLRNPPSVTTFPHGSSVSPGNSYQFTLVFKNNDTGLCSSFNTQLNYDFPTSGWNVSSPLPFVYGNAGDTMSFDIEITNPANTIPNQTYYPVVRTSENGIGVHSSAFTIPYYVTSGVPQGVCTPQNKIITVTPASDTSSTCHNIQQAIDSTGVDGGYTVVIQPGTYNLPGTINVNGKNNLTITGNPEGSIDVTTLNFTPNGWGFLVQNSSGAIRLLKITGGSSNGMISILSSSDFQLERLKVHSGTSHTIDVQGSTNVNINDSEITSSAGALEIQNSTNTSIANNKIHDSANAVSIHNSSGTVMVGNLIDSNRESGLYINSASNTAVNHNTIINNGTNSNEAGVSLHGNINLLNFSNNLVINNRNQGMLFDGGGFTRTLGHNDVWNNAKGNYSGFDDYTGVNGNISANPLLNQAQAGYYCLLNGSPAVYGSINNQEYMGHIGPCSTSTPTPSYCSSDPFIINITPQLRNGAPGETVRYGVSVTNNKIDCGSYTTHLIIDKPANWQTTFGTDTFILAPNHTYNTYLDVTSSTSNYVLGNNILAFRISTEEFGYMGMTQIIYNLVPRSNADLVVQNISLEKIFPPNSPCVGYRYTVTVKNIGTDNAPTARLKTIITPTQNQAIEGCTIIQPYVGSNAPIPSHENDLYLEPNSTDTQSDYINPTSAGEINIVSTIDFNEQVIEKNNDNNTLTKTFNVDKVYPSTPGDINSDGHVNIIDIGILIDNYRMSPPNNPAADLNNDGVVNIVDIGIIVDHYEF